MYQVNLGNDLLLTFAFALLQEAGQAINLTEAQGLAVTLKQEQTQFLQIFSKAE